MARDPDDWEACEARADALYVSSRPQETLAALHQVLAKARRETALFRAASAAQDLNQNDLALEYWRRAIEVNPWAPNYRQAICTQLANRAAWEEFRRVPKPGGGWTRRALRHAAAGSLTSCASAESTMRAEFARIRALRHRICATLQAWFDAETRQSRGDFGEINAGISPGFASLGLCNAFVGQPFQADPAADFE